MQRKMTSIYTGSLLNFELLIEEFLAHCCILQVFLVPSEY